MKDVLFVLMESIYIICILRARAGNNFNTEICYVQKLYDKLYKNICFGSISINWILRTITRQK